MAILKRYSVINRPRELYFDNDDDVNILHENLCLFINSGPELQHLISAQIEIARLISSVYYQPLDGLPIKCNIILNYGDKDIITNICINYKYTDKYLGLAIPIIAEFNVMLCNEIKRYVNESSL